MDIITSRKNPLMKQLKKLLSSSSARRESGLAVVEGPHLAAEALRSGVKIEQLIVTNAAANENNEISELVTSAIDKDIEIVRVSVSCYESFSALKSPEGIAILFRPQIFELSQLLYAECRLAILCGVQDPGNAGAVVRTAEAAQCSGVILCCGADLTHPAFMRAAMGATFRLPVCRAEPEAFFEAIRGMDIRLFALAADGAVSYDKADYTAPCGILTGSEGQGLDEEFMKITTEKIFIPMSGSTESLNAAVATGIVLYEARKSWV